MIVLCWKKMKILKRLFWGLLVVIFGFGLILAGSIAIDYVIGRERVAAVTNTTISGLNGGPDVRAYVAMPQGDGPFPVVIMIHEFFELNESIVGKAKGLAEEGYLVVAPDTFRGSTTQWIPRAIFQVITNKSEQVNQDLELGIRLDKVSAQCTGEPDRHHWVLLRWAHLVDLQPA